MESKGGDIILGTEFSKAAGTSEPIGERLSRIHTTVQGLVSHFDTIHHADKSITRYVW